MTIKTYILAAALLASMALGFASVQPEKADPIGNKTCCSARI